MVARFHFIIIVRNPDLLVNWDFRAETEELCFTLIRRLKQRSDQDFGILAV